MTAQKISIYGDDTAKWLPTLLHNWGKDSVPSVWGGQCMHKNGDCFPIITAQRSKHNEELLIITDYTGQSGTGTVKAGRLYTIESEYGSKPADRQHDRTLHYRVSTDDDITFSVVYIDALNPANSRTVRQPQRLHSADAAINGEYTVSKECIGCVQMIFDNTHSTWNSKHVQWSAKIVAHTNSNNTFL